MWSSCVLRASRSKLFAFSAQFSEFSGVAKYEPIIVSNKSAATLCFQK